jgi:ligand-binding sensor domain-containing protein
MKRKRHLILLLLGLLGIMWLTLNGSSSAQDQWKHFGNSEDIRALHQKGDTLWVGTNGGLLFMDVLSEEIVGKMVTGPYLPSNSIRAIYSNAGVVYLGTDEGLVRIDAMGARIFTRGMKPVFADIRSISSGPADTLFIGTFGHGVGVLHGTRTGRITKADSLLDNKVFDVAAVDSTTRYFATSAGLCAFKDSVWVSYQAGAGLPRGEVLRILPASGSNFYLLIGGHGIYRFDGTKARRIPLRGSLNDNDISAITLDRGGALWAAGRFGGIARYQYGRWERVGSGDGITDMAHWRSAHTGPTGTLFFGSADGWIVKVDDDDIRQLYIPSAVPRGAAGAMAEAADGQKIIGKGSSVIVNVDDADRFILDTGLNHVFDFARSPSGELWACTRWGLFRRTADRWIGVYPAIEPQAPLFISLAFEPSGRLWAGTQSGEVYRFDGELWIQYGPPAELTPGPFCRIRVDGWRNIWALSRDAGLFRFGGSRWTRYDVDGFQSKEFKEATLDPSGNLIVLTEGRLWRFGNEQWREIGFRQPPPGTYRTVSFDRWGRLYLGTSAGLYCAGGGAPLWVGNRDGIRGCDITTLFVDTGDHLWVGFLRDGLSRISLDALWEPGGP